MQDQTGLTPSAIRIVSLAFDSLDLLCKERGGLGVRELARKLGVGKSSAHRILQTLEARGLARQDRESERYMITAQLIRLASQVQVHLELRAVARPFLSGLRKCCGETVFMGILDRPEVVIVDRIDSSEPLRMTKDIGFREPAYCTALGKVLLAGLSEKELVSFLQSLELKAYTSRTPVSVEVLKAEISRVRLTGFALDDEETLAGVRCVAAPIRDASGSIVAAISISGPSARISPERVAGLAQEVRLTAEHIARELGFVGQPFGSVEMSTIDLELRSPRPGVESSRERRLA